MRLLKFSMIVFLGLFGTLALSSCGNKGSNSGETEEVDRSGKEYTSTYVCPMHCEGSGSDEPGTCPVCGMDYVLNEEHTSDGHQHGEHDHEGGDHDGHDHHDDGDHKGHNH